MNFQYDGVQPLARVQVLYQASRVRCLSTGAVLRWREGGEKSKSFQSGDAVYVFDDRI